MFSVLCTLEREKLTDPKISFMLFIALPISTHTISKHITIKHIRRVSLSTDMLGWSTNAGPSSIARVECSAALMHPISRSTQEAFVLASLSTSADAHQISSSGDSSDRDLISEWPRLTSFTFFCKQWSFNRVTM